LPVAALLAAARKANAASISWKGYTWTLGMNLWCYDIPSDGQDVEMVIRDFQFVPLPTPIAAGRTRPGRARVAAVQGARWGSVSQRHRDRSVCRVAKRR